MHFARFGVALERLEDAHLERVRTWRNRDHVRPFMRHDAVVEPDGHRLWFASLDPRCDWYFTATQEGRPFALVHVKHVDWRDGCGEAGGFVGEATFLGRPEPALAVLALMDFAFLVLGLRALEAQYHPDRSRTGRFNAQLGYEVIRRESDGFVRARVPADTYFARAATFRRAAVARSDATATLTGPDAWLAARLRTHPPVVRDDFRLQLR